MLSKNVFMFPHCSPSSHNSVGLDPNEVFLHHHDMLPGHYSAGEPLAVVNQCTTAKASKKDRHSKIYTAQGPRDRRVRLSIGVARKFFDLQESLGFDKPSKTLDWLLTKSKAAIKDVVQMREKAGTAKDGSSECEVDSAQASENGADLKLKGAAKDPTPASNLAKESRVKARARARERTREKMSIKKLNNNAGYDLNPTVPIQSMNDQLKISGSSSNINMLHYHYPTYESANDHEDLIQESIVIKRKVKHHPSILGFQQNLIMSSSNYGVPSPYNAAADQNWDISCCFTSSQSNI